jgi:hypothetical protein
MRRFIECVIFDVRLLIVAMHRKGTSCAPLPQGVRWGRMGREEDWSARVEWMRRVRASAATWGVDGERLLSVELFPDPPADGAPSPQPPDARVPLRVVPPPRGGAF